MTIKNSLWKLLSEFARIVLDVGEVSGFFMEVVFDFGQGF